MRSLVFYKGEWLDNVRKTQFFVQSKLIVKSSQDTIIYIALFTMQIVLKQLYGIKQGNNV